ncbi:DUF305 domain-containing protein [Actinocrispum wychmicini]|uniref:Uncharacterized protein (DUF305 family) n=1 Tax=Actinocrispum wychmicini TaxID=1213861 RepID=A0A4R2IK59_9PSEU|nr:DUF305 domain-containing protein [Actinocrispum wychmicini]TCO44239.1 uncharacterized protein (DUF305 family) [Actinocrispum wychmicini]
MRSRLIATFVVLVLALAGCGQTATSAGPAKSDDHNDADVQFSLNMIPHHRQTIQIADLATRLGGTEQVKVVAAEILSPEEQDVQTMNGWLRSWNVAPPADMSGMDMDMPGMLSAKDIKSLQTTTGADFDKKFLTMVAKHLQNGVDMAKQVLNTGKHAGTKTLANKIVKEQGEQIQKVQALKV